MEGEPVAGDMVGSSTDEGQEQESCYSPRGFPRALWLPRPILPYGPLMMMPHLASMMLPHLLSPLTPQIVSLLQPFPQPASKPTASRRTPPAPLLLSRQPKLPQRQHFPLPPPLLLPPLLRRRHWCQGARLLPLPRGRLRLTRWRQ